MPYVVTANELELLQHGVAHLNGAALLSNQVRLAWHLRQRDSAQALQLAQSAAPGVDALPGGAERRSLQRLLALTRAEVSALFSQADAAEHWLAQALALSASDAPDASTLAWVEALVAKVQGQRERELLAYERARTRLQRAGHAALLSLARAWLHYEASFADPQRPDDPLLRAGPRSTATDTFYVAAQGIQWSRREPERAAEAFLRASEQAQRVGFVRHAVVCTLNASAAWQGLGELERAAACLDVAEAVVRRTGWPSLLGLVQTRMGAFLAARGHGVDACELLQEAVRTQSLTPGSINRANACSELALTLMRMGRAPDAVEPMAQAIEVYRSNSSTDNLALNLIHQTKVLVAVGRADEALQAIREAEGLIAQHGLSALQVGVHEALAVLYRRHPALHAGPTGTAPTGALHHAEAALQQGQSMAGWRAPSELFTIMADEWHTAGHPARGYQLARQAIDALRDELSIARSLRHDPFPLRRAHLPPPLDPEGLWRPAAVDAEPAPVPVALLTPKELAVLKLVALQYANKEIALALELGAETVKWHLKKIFGKLDVGTRRRAVAKARVMGLL